MALTHHLDNPASPVRRFLEERFAIVDQSKRGSLFADEVARFLGLKDMPRDAILKSLAAPGYAGPIGTALDYRIRYYFGVYDSTSTVAARGAALLRGIPLDRATHAPLETLEVPRAADLADEFFERHDRTLARVNPSRRRLTEEDENTLARHCMILAYFEAIYRAGRGIGSPLYQLTKNATVVEMLALVPDECVADVRQLSYGFEEDARSLFAAPARLNPKFAGSSQVGGADADLVLGDILVEIKTIAKVDPGKLREAVFQLLGYTLLDYDDDYQIRHIGVYLTRQRKMWNAPLWHFLLPIASVMKMVPNNEEPDANEVSTMLSEARIKFRKIASKAGHR